MVLRDPTTTDGAIAADAASLRRRRILLAVPLVLFLALAALFVVRLFAGDPAQIPSALIGRPVPQFSLPPLEGLLRDGQPVPGLTHESVLPPGPNAVTVVNIWASWCVPCRQEHPLLASLAQDPRVKLVGINYKDNPENARRFLGALGNPFAAVGVDAAGRASIDWGVYGVPETFIVSRDGRIRHKHIGPLTPEALQTSIKAAIDKAAQP
ncbi:cytochrome c biogenesis protein CcmG/thiol:disulfide interchange protein DsbE [Chelatococcus asaccharovorans]|uniref:Cytochrome c biogenesis protein CcmG/thiol:disulfide interchange protein DsbE n=1 Tax=Chelatococcus asaccharovorans TaxID=28210 RepID=A0A2V3U7C3_9HYPH|nr:DsbE family thiol:disulfide interchange protein [Chelatococcus asaccharovorans]PXW58769.1 cytochrome c biogenesis protein CcmG/thiol:disulfide interchange protein DsbE [Chelatococcus asaccharovorans]